MNSISSPFEMPTTVERELPRYYCGVDLGQSHDHTAIAILRRVQFFKTNEGGQRNAKWTEHKPSVFQLGYLERVPLGTTYPGIVAHVQAAGRSGSRYGSRDYQTGSTGRLHSRCRAMAAITQRAH
jgi:hypothetical protein